jgi:hypothetical protein
MEIFKVLRIDFAWSNYLNTPDTNRFTVKGSFDLLLGIDSQLSAWKVSDAAHKSKRKKELLQIDEHSEIEIYRLRWSLDGSICTFLFSIIHEKRVCLHINK